MLSSGSGGEATRFHQIFRWRISSVVANAGASPTARNACGRLSQWRVDHRGHSGGIPPGSGRKRLCRRPKRSSRVSLGRGRLQSTTGLGPPRSRPTRKCCTAILACERAARVPRGGLSFCGPMSAFGTKRTSACALTCLLLTQSGHDDKTDPCGVICSAKEQIDAGRHHSRPEYGASSRLC